MKRCTKCGESKPLTQFGRDARTRDGYHQHCLQCKREARRKWRENHPAQARAEWQAWSAANYDRHLARNRRWQAANREKMQQSMLKSRYGITLEQYQQLFEAQSGQCKICGKRGKLVVDHKHDDTRQVRGLLCMHCNSGIGFFQENVEVMLSAIGYLTQGEAYDRERSAITIQIASR